ncbi:BglG family transcription antiterminator [Fundicoccus culcitae]|uniref:BglG family transcription antiterminator n=1 Tax=Fundicoccus culcitae TaxID=2969821 RepID=A0ABY5P523_9LACT|nr:BglG family transcription antiterminator [Fundicoccus culcitae]UUX33528.1 BglG family transcription antiterminator [Fundicoccus culcitae]
MKSRLFEMLQILVSQQNYPITINEIAQKFSVTERTIRSDIKSINEFLTENNLKTLQVNKNRIIINLSNEEIRKFENINKPIDYYSNSQLRLLDLILSFTFGEVKFIYRKQEEYNISKSTIDSDVKIVRELLEKYHLSLNNQTTKFIEVIGNEKAIRVMVFNVINKIIGVVDITNDAKNQTPERRILFQYLPLKSFLTISDLYNKYIDSDNDVMYKNQTILYLIIWIHRLKNGYKLQGEYFSEEKLDTTFDSLFKEIIEQFDIAISVSEKHYIKLINETLDSESYNEFSEWSRGQIITIDLIEYVQDKLNIEFERKDELFSGLFKHIIKLINRIKNNIQIVNPLTDEIKSNNEKLFNTIKSFKYQEQDYFNNMTDDEIAYLAIYFLVSLSKNRQNNVYIFNAVVFCNYGKATSQLIAHMLEENFNVKVIANLSTDEITLINKLDVDIAFSTINIQLDTIPLLIIDSILIKENYGKIQRFLDIHDDNKRQIKSEIINNNENSQLFTDILQLINKSKGQVNESIYQELIKIFKNNNLYLDAEATLPKIKDVLLEGNIIFNLKAFDWQDAITKTATPLLEKGIINSNYLEAMITAVRLHGPYIAIAPNIALAHSRPNDGVNQLGLSVSKLITPINFGHDSYDPIKIVFCIAPVDSYTHINIMKSIFNLINTENKLQMLTESEGIDDFKRTLIEERDD